MNFLAPFSVLSESSVVDDRIWKAGRQEVDYDYDYDYDHDYDARTFLQPAHPGD